MAGETIDFEMASPYEAEARKLERRQRMAELLQAQALAPIERAGYKGIEAPISPLAGLAKVLQSYMSGREMSKIGEAEDALFEQSRTDEAADIEQMANILSRQKQEGIPEIPASYNPVQKLSANDLLSGNQPPNPNFTPVPVPVDSVDPLTGVTTKPIPGGGMERITPAVPARVAGQFDAADIKAFKTPQMQQLALAQMLAQNAPKEPPSSIQEYEYAKGQGYTGTYQEFQDRKKPPTETSLIQEYEYAKGQGYTGTFQEFVLARSRAKSPTNIFNKSTDKYAEKVSVAAAERDEAQYQAAVAAVVNMEQLDETLKHLRGSDAITGIGSELLKNIQRMSALLLKSKSAGKQVTDTELLDAMLGSDVFPMIQSLGIGSKGMDTPQEREFLRRVMTGTTELNKETLIRMTEIRRAIGQRVIEDFNKRVEDGGLDRYFEYSGNTKSPMEVVLAKNYADEGVDAETKTQTPAAIKIEAPPGVPPEVWNKLTRQEQLLFIKQ